jgi:uncharacterized protein YbcI
LKGVNPISTADSHELTAAVAGVYACFLGREPESVRFTPAHFGARVLVEGGRSLLEQALLRSGREDLFRAERRILEPPMLEALQARAELVLDARIEDLKLESDIVTARDTFLMVLTEAPAS